MGIKPVIASIVHVTAWVVGVCAAILLVLGWILRQPNLGSLPFPQGSRADPSRLEAHVRFLASTAPARWYEDEEGLERAAGYILEAFTSTGADCTEQHYKAGKTTAKNISARFGPPGGTVIVVGAHYDVFGELPGADDNASGVAGLLELARMLSGQKLETAVELVAYSTEEPPFYGTGGMGSAVHAASIKSAGTKVRAMIALEMIGYFAPTQTGQIWPLYLIYPFRGDFVSLTGRWQDRALVRFGKKAFRGATNVPVVSYSGPSAVGSDMSDHRNYWVEGISAIMVTDTAFLRNPNYHSSLDTPSTLDYRKMAFAVDGVFSMVVHLANDLF